MTRGAPLLSVEDLAVHFHHGGWLPLSRPRPLKAVDGVSFDVAEGETLGIVGESGCGKSTLARAVLHLIRPSAGRVGWLGRDLSALTPAALREQRRDLQIVFQDPLASLDPRMTVGKIVGEPLEVFERRLAAREKRDRVAAMLETIGLSAQMLNRYPHEFSGGQCQRIGIARAMILNPRLVICDEPVSALDVSIQAQIINLLMRLQREFGTAMIFISHDLSVVRHISHRILVMYLGKVMEIADSDSLYRRPAHPYTEALISAVPLPDPVAERSRHKIVLEGDLPSPLDPPSGCVFRTRCPHADARCATETPSPRPSASGGLVACHYPRGRAPRRR